MAKETSADDALLIAELWIRESIESIRQNNNQKSLMNIRLLFNKAQSELMAQQAAVENLRTQVSQTHPLITISRGVDDRQLWSDLTQKPGTNPDALKKLSEIHIKGQEQSEEYINLTKALLITEQALTAAGLGATFFKKLSDYSKLRLVPKTLRIALKVLWKAKDLSLRLSGTSTLYLSALIAIQFGEPGLIWDGPGALLITALVFLTSLVLASFCALVYEWWTGSGQREDHV